jgi:hypothetical protein
MLCLPCTTMVAHGHGTGEGQRAAHLVTAHRPGQQLPQLWLVGQLALQRGARRAGGHCYRQAAAVQVAKHAQGAWQELGIRPAAASKLHCQLLVG